MASLRDEIARYGRHLVQYRATLDPGGDPAVVGQWITETQSKKLVADARLRASSGTGAEPRRMTREEIESIVPPELQRRLPECRRRLVNDKAVTYSDRRFQWVRR